MGSKELANSHPKKYGKGSRSCRVCGNQHGLVRKYAINMCRQCFRQYANDIGFHKVRKGCWERLVVLVEGSPLTPLVSAANVRFARDSTRKLCE